MVLLLLDVFVAFGGGERGIRKGVGAVLWRLLLGMGMNIKVGGRGFGLAEGYFQIVTGYELLIIG